MPIYTFKACECDQAKQEFGNANFDIHTSAKYKDLIECGYCRTLLDRVWNFQGSVYAPTAGGMR